MAKVLKDIRKNLKGHELRDNQILFRVSSKEKAEIQKTAKSLGLSVTQYLIGLHRYAVNTGE